MSMEPSERSWKELSEKFVSNDKDLVEEYNEHVMRHGVSIESRIIFLQSRQESAMVFVNVIMKKLERLEQLEQQGE